MLDILKLRQFTIKKFLRKTNTKLAQCMNTKTTVYFHVNDHSASLLQTTILLYLTLNMIRFLSLVIEITAVLSESFSASQFLIGLRNGAMEMSSLQLGMIWPLSLTQVCAQRCPWHLHSFLLSPFSWNVNGIGIAAAALNYTRLFAKMLGLPYPPLWLWKSERESNL